MPTVVFRGSRADVITLVRTLVSAAAGRSADPLGVVEPVLTRGAVALLSKIQQAFVVKARGGTDEAGITWKPLERKTVAGRRTTRAELKSLGITGRRERGLLTPAQNQLWRRIYAQVRARLHARGVTGREADATAARIAWAKLKQ